MYWVHANFESGSPANLVPVREAGLQSCSSGLDVRFSNRSALIAG
jgi:hypothetical protein